MRSMNFNNTVLVGVTALLSVGISAQAQVNIVDTIGNQAKWGIGNSKQIGVPVGYDADVNGNPGIPGTPQTAGYAVMPFTLSNTFVQGVSEVDIVATLQPGSGTSGNLGSLSGAIVAANTAGSLSLTGLSSSDFFSFDTTPSNNPTDPSQGDGFARVYSATNLPTYNLSPNTTYWLIVAPKKGLGASASDALLDFGLFDDQRASNITASAGSLSNSYATVGQGLAEQQGANAGDTLSPIRFGTSAQPGYFGARITGNAVPEPSSLLVMAGGLLPFAVRAVRRRK